MYQAHAECLQAGLIASGFQRDTENTIKSGTFFFPATVETFL